MKSRRLFWQVAVSLILAGPAGGLLFGMLNAGDPDPNPIGRVVYALMMAVQTPWHAGFPPHLESGTVRTLNVWPHITVAFALILGFLVLRDRERSASQPESK